MMYHFKCFLIAYLVIYSNIGLTQDTDSECLNHLGGALSGVECFNGLANGLKKDNMRLFREINSTIPKHRKSRSLLRDYMLSEKAGIRFCALYKNSYLHWNIEKSLSTPQYHDFDVVYYECIYNRRLEQNRFLNILQQNLSQ